VPKGRSGSEQARLITIGTAEPHIYPLGKRKNLIGSSRENDLIVQDQTVSRRHAVIRRRWGRYRLTDLKSTNGTFVNGRPVTGTVAIRPGDEIRFGKTRLLLAAPKTSTSFRPRVALGLIAISFLVGFLLTDYLSSPVPGHLSKRTEPLVTPSKGPSLANASRATENAAATPSRVPAPTVRSMGSRDRSAEVAASAAPRPSSPPPRLEDASPGGWLGQLNHYRVMAGQPPVREDPELSDADQKHARYLAENYVGDIRSGINIGASAHREEPGNPWFTAEGARAATKSDIWCFQRPGRNQPGPIETWLSGAFHRPQLLSPALKSVGYGTYCKDDLCVAALYCDLHPTFGAPAIIEFPPKGTVISLRYVRDEWPNPLSSCPGYREPAGLTITLSLGSFVPVKLLSHSLTEEGGALVEHCAFDADTYVNPEPGAQELGRQILRSFSQVVMVPRRPLRGGATYTVTVTVGPGAQTYSWSFEFSALKK
jgi:hypothetical protein